jgi:UDP-N-acetyl-D-glucosamine dehydrogenase
MSSSTPAISTTADTLRRFHDRTARIGIIGMGYVGLPLALLFSEERFAVTGFDIDPSKVEALNSGGSYIVRIPGTEIQARAETRLQRHRGLFANRSQMDAVIICVPTPLNEYHEPDLSYITGHGTLDRSPYSPDGPAHHAGKHHLSRHYGRSRSPAARRRRAQRPAKFRAIPPRQDSYLAFSPEREDPGNDTVARRDIPKVVGGIGPESLALAQRSCTPPSSTAPCPCQLARRGRDDQAA